MLFLSQKEKDEQGITGKFIRLKLINPPEENIFRNIGKTPPVGICVNTKTTYHVACCPMTWGILDVLENEEDFDRLYPIDKWWAPGGKGLMKNRNCWELLAILGDTSQYPFRLESSYLGYFEHC
jgi:hypothetical protein